MSIGIILLLIGVLFLIISHLIRNKYKRLSRILVGLTIFLFLGPTYMPRWLWGKWNVARTLEGKEVRRMVLVPWESNFAVNLTDHVIPDFSKSQIDDVLKLLGHTEIYSPSHPMRVWEAKLILITTDADSLVLDILKTQNNETLIYTASHNIYIKDELGEYLERVTNFKEPVKAP